MADVAAARREARRRKILENSHNRLKIISGKNSDECLKESPVTTVIPEPDYDIPIPATASSSNYNSTSQPNGVPCISAALTELLASHDIDASGDCDIVNDLAPLLPATGLVLPSSESETVSTTIWEKITASKYDIVLLSFLLQILYSLSLLTFERGYFFVPVIVYVVTKLIRFPTQSSSGIANMLMLLNGMSSSRIQRILSLSQCFGVITHDIFIFLFTTVCTQALCVMLRDNLVT